MSSSAEFVRIEAADRSIGAFRASRRLLLALPLFLRILPLSLFCILFSSIAPSIFRWYAGSLASSEGVHRVPHLGWQVPVNLEGLVGLALLGTFFRIAAWATFELSGMWSAQGIHARMTLGLSRTRTTFFDENPSGRLINRLVRDYDEVRSTAIIFIGDVLNAVTELLSVAVLAFVVSPWAALAVFPLLGVFSFMQWHRSGMLGHARGLTAISTSRVLDRKTDLVEGAELFLLYGKSGRLLSRLSTSYRQYINGSTLGFFVETWASFWIRASAEVFSFVVLISLVFLLARGGIDTTLAGVIISALFGIRGTIGWLDIATSLLSRSVPHVERVFEFVDLPKEESEEGAVLPKNGERAVSRSPLAVGDVRFERYSMSYRKDTPVILRDLDLELKAGTKTALIGRTGSGKTSLVQALFRMVYVQGGDLKIAGQSVYKADIHAIRALFGVVPQFPYLFAGDLRSNLDRTGALDDSILARSLAVVGLRFPLDQPVLEGGQNFSVGERQLVCLARIIASERRYVLMDEPTSGLDPETDARIHRILRTGLAGKTVLTIAHRRESLGAYDRVVEMSEGRVIWSGTPAELQKRDGATR